MTKGDFITYILRDPAEILAFVTWLTSADPGAQAAKFAWDNSGNVEIDSEFVSALIPSLVPAVLHQSVEDRRAAEAALQNAGQPVTPKKRYRVPIPDGVTDPYTWVSQYATADIYAAVLGTDIYVSAYPGTFAHPDATEVA